MDKNGRKRKVELKWNMQLLLEKQEAFLPSTKTLRAWTFFPPTHSLQLGWYKFRTMVVYECLFFLLDIRPSYVIDEGLKSLDLHETRVWGEIYF